MAYVIYDANDNIVSLASLTNGMTAGAVTGATVTLRLLNGTTVVSGATGISMVASTGATSTYRGTQFHRPEAGSKSRNQVDDDESQR